MGFPKDVRVIETMIGTRAGKSAKLNYQNLTGMKDKIQKDITFRHSTCSRMCPGATKLETLRSNRNPHKDLSCYCLIWKSIILK